MQDTKPAVRATCNNAKGEELLVNYGDSARPAWRCLSSYGFVPEYDVDLEVEDDWQNVESVTKLWMNGLRFEVDPHLVPYDLKESRHKEPRARRDWRRWVSKLLNEFY